MANSDCSVARCQAGGGGCEFHSQCDRKAVAEERDQDMGFDAFLCLVMDRPQAQAALECIERLFNVR